MRILILSWEYPPYVVGGMGKHVAEIVPELAARMLDPVRLDAAEAAELRFGCDGECFALAVEDPFGTLAPERARQHLAESLRLRTVPVREGPGGAGLGLFEVLSSVSHLLIDVAPGSRTEVLARLRGRLGRRPTGAAGPARGALRRGLRARARSE